MNDDMGPLETAFMERCRGRRYVLVEEKEWHQLKEEMWRRRGAAQRMGHAYPSRQVHGAIGRYSETSVLVDSYPVSGLSGRQYYQLLQVLESFIHMAYPGEKLDAALALSRELNLR